MEVRTIMPNGVCKYNQWVLCEDRNCNECGWNPKIEVKRKGRKVTKTTPESIAEMEKIIEERRLEKALKASPSPQAKAVVCIETGVVFPSVKQAAEYYAVDPASISNTCKGKAKTARGMHWRYADSANS